MPPATRSKDPQPPRTHILEFFYDDDDGCAFTARINDERFHIIVEAAELKQSGKGKNELLDEYLQRLKAVRENDKAEEEAEEKTQNSDSTKRSADEDSGVDVTHDSTEKRGHHQEPLRQESSKNPSLELQNWILECFAGEPQPAKTEDADEEDTQQIQLTLEQWYETPIRYYDVVLSDDGKSLQPRALEETDILRKRLDDLLPRVSLPKTLRSLQIPWIHASDITVLAESEEPPPVHPSLVSAKIDDGDDKAHDNNLQTYFFKPVDPSQPQPTKREINILHKIAIKGLSSQFHVPRLHALVSHSSSKIDTIGFLLTAIDTPTPLTKLLDSEVDESLRKKWAKETQRIVDVLHENGIVWGDAKADNFLVDKQNELWVIDFGGSYTEEWVDAELNETVEGDEMGLERIVNGLLEPDEMTCDPEAGLDGPQRVNEEAEGRDGDITNRNGKRSRADMKSPPEDGEDQSGGSEGENHTRAKRSKR